jgi:YVTN family beta-propeller protein
MIAKGSECCGNGVRPIGMQLRHRLGVEDGSMMMSSTWERRLSRRMALSHCAKAGVGMAAGLSAPGSSLLAAAPRARRELAYVCNALDDSVTVIDVPAGKILTTIPFDWGTKRLVPRWPASLGSVMRANAPMNATFTPDRRQVWVPNSKGRNIAVIDTAANKVVRRITLPMDPCDVNFTPDGRRAVATLIGDTVYQQGGLIIIDVASGALSAPILTGTQPEELAITPDGKRVYQISKSMWVVDIDKAVVEREVYLPLRGYDVVVSPDGKQAFTGSTFGGDKIIVVENASEPKGIVVSGMIDANEPCCMIFSHDGRLMYVTSNSKNTVQIIDMATRKIVRTGQVPQMPAVMALTANGDKLYVAHNIGDSVTVVDARSLAVLGRIKCGDQPNSVAIAQV